MNDNFIPLEQIYSGYHYMKYDFRPDRVFIEETELTVIQRVRNRFDGYLRFTFWLLKEEDYIEEICEDHGRSSYGWELRYRI
jgi:hypothetical protein